MSRMRVLLIDFAPRRARSTALGWMLLAAGIAAASACGLLLDQVLAERGRLADVLESLAARKHPRAEDPQQAKQQEDLLKMDRELSIPWTKLLAELESASADMAGKVALLQVEPDADKHIVRISAEVRSLPDGLAYLERLQKSAVLRYPLLESHERSKDDAEHPVRIKLAADWRP